MSTRIVLAVFLVGSLAACKSGDKKHEHANKTTNGARTSTDHTNHAKAKGHDGHGQADRTLKAVMQGLQNNMAALSAGLWRDNWSQVAKEAKAIADHPHVGKTGLARLKAKLGKDIKQFVAEDKIVHDAALRLSKTAPGGDSNAILEQLATIQRGCISCHNKFRKRLAN